MTGAAIPAGDDIPVRRPDVEWVELDGEAVVYDPEAHTLHRLNGTAAQVWAACDGSWSVDKIVQTMTAAYTEPGDAIAHDVRQLIGRLHREGLLQDHVPGRRLAGG